MFKKFDKYNWLLLIIGVCYVLLAFVNIEVVDQERDEHFKEATGYEECKDCKDSIVHVVIPKKKPRVETEDANDD